MATEILYVETYTAVQEEWIETGNSPWLQDSDADYLNSDANNEYHKEFAYEDTTLAWSSITSIKGYIENMNEYKTPYSSGGTYSIYHGDEEDMYNLPFGFAWRNLVWRWDITGELKNVVFNDIDELNDARCKIKSSIYVAGLDIYARRAYLLITYTVETPFIGDGLSYVKTSQLKRVGNCLIPLGSLRR